MLIINVDIRTMAEKNYKNGYIRIQDGRIAALGDMSGCPVPDGEIFDGRGMIAMPGLIDAHCHIGMWEDGMGFEGDDGNEDTDPSTPQLRGIDGVNPFDRSFSEALDYGVTTVVTGPGSSNPLAGQLCAIKTCGRRVDDMIIRAPLAIKMAMGENPKTSYHEKPLGPATRMAVAALIREQLAKARRYLEQADDAARDDELEPPEYDAKCEALVPLLRGEIKAHIHAHRTDDIFTGMRIAKEFGFGCVIIHATEGHLVAEELASEGIPVILGPLMGARTKPELSRADIAGAGILDRAGVRVAISTDHPEMPCHYLLMSAQLACSAGLERDAALRAITIEPAKICGIDSRVGSLEIGKDADIALFSEEPIETRLAPCAVFINGAEIKPKKSADECN